jgi:hypothetical protein
VRDLVLAQPEEPVRDLLTSCKRDQPELWKNMFMEVELAFKDRRQK